MAHRVAQIYISLALSETMCTGLLQVWHACLHLSFC